MEKLKEVEWLKHGFKLAIIGLFSVCGMLYAQQNNIIASQGQLIKENCAKTERDLKLKVDNETMIRMIKNIDLRQEIDTEHWKEQKALNIKMLKSIQDLNINVLLLNEKMK